MFKQLKQFIILCLPPILTNALWVLRSKLRGEKAELPILEYAPDGWNAQIKADGWNLSRVAEVEKAKWPSFCKNLDHGGPLGFSHEHTDLSVVHSEYFHNIHVTYGYVIGLSAQAKQEIRVLDIGGGLGHYYMLAKSMWPNIKINYSCMEVPLMSESGRQVCPEVTFYDDDKCFETKYDLVMLNGSLGYFKDWKQLIRKASQSVSQFLFLTRVLVVENVPGFVVLQRTNIYDYGSNMLTQVFNRGEVIKTVESNGLRRVRDFVVGNGPNINNAPAQSRDEGWLFKRIT